MGNRLAIRALLAVCLVSADVHNLPIALIGIGIGRISRIAIDLATDTDP
jgi:hypothetical protein